VRSYISSMSMNTSGYSKVPHRMVELKVSIPTVHAEVEKMYRQGNRMWIDGQLDSRVEYLHGQPVVVKFQELGTEWAWCEEELTDKPGGEPVIAGPPLAPHGTLSIPATCEQ
jgi:hypothetical protein